MLHYLSELGNHITETITGAPSQRERGYVGFSGKALDEDYAYEWHKVFIDAQEISKTISVQLFLQPYLPKSCKTKFHPSRVCVKNIK